MKHFGRLLITVALSCALATAPFGGAWGQAPPDGAKQPVRGYTRTNKKTGQPFWVRPYKRRPPQPKAVEVRSYLRKGLRVMGYQRRRPGESKPGESKPGESKP